LARELFNCLKIREALLSLVDYFVLVQLRSLYCWCNSSYKAKWKEIEKEIKSLNIFSFPNEK